MVDSAIEVDAKQGIEFADKQETRGRRRVDLLVVASIVLLGLGALVSLAGRSELAADGPEPAQHFCWCDDPRAHGAGTPADQRLHGQHNIHWIPDGYMGAGNFLVYNNGDDIEERPWSSVDEWRLPMGADGSINPPVKSI